MTLRIALPCLLTLLLAGTANAKGVAISPGQWEMTTTMTMTMMPTPQTTTEMECIEEDELSPEMFNMDEENPCDITNVIFEGNTARWSTVCPIEGGPAMKGQWAFTSNGDSLTGNGSWTANYGGQKMSFNVNWKGKRVGDCQ